MSCSRATEGVKHSKYGKKTNENGKKEKGNDFNSHVKHEDPCAGSDLEMDSRILSALLTVRLALCTVFIYVNCLLLYRRCFMVLPPS